MICIVMFLMLLMLKFVNYCQLLVKWFLLIIKKFENFEMLKNVVNFLVKFLKNQEIDKVLISELYYGKFFSFVEFFLNIFYFYKRLYSLNKLCLYVIQIFFFIVL